jgi:hypothetical protein
MAVQLPISEFLRAKLKEYDSTFEVRSGTGFDQLFFKPLQFIVQPLRDEASAVFTNQSLLRILLTDNPDTYSEDAVDDIVSNIFITRVQGDVSSGVARIYYNTPIDKEFVAGGLVFTGSNGQTYTNIEPFTITTAEMELQIEDGLYYIDITIQSENSGADTVLDTGELINIAGDDDAVRVFNNNPISGGIARETNSEFIKRAQDSIGVRDLVVGKGFRAILFDNFPGRITELQPIGFSDGEMMRDIVYNTHIGGRVDGYVKTTTITTGFKNFVGVLIDNTRQAFTSANIALSGISFQSLKHKNIDRSNNLLPIVREIKKSTSATFLSTIDISSPLNLASNQFVKIGIDGTFLNIRVAGATSGNTTRNEIVNLINAAFGYIVAKAVGNTIRLTSRTQGLSSSIVLTNPDTGTNALALVFGLSTLTAPHAFNGDGPVTFIEGNDYEINDQDGLIKRIVGPLITPLATSGVSVTNSTSFSDPSSNAFLGVVARDVLTITTGVDQGDYRILSVVDNNNLVLDKKLTLSLSAVNYTIRRTGIKNNEIVYTSYYFNPVSIDIGNKIALDPYGRLRGFRTDREEYTISDLPLLRITSIEEIDPLTLEPTGTILDGTSGYGQGSYGSGAYGVGSAAQYRLVINKPELRFSMFEDSYIVFNDALEGLSFRVNYEYVPEIEDYHNFVRSPSERVLDGDILMKHFIPAYVNGTINYKVLASSTTAIDNDTLTSQLKDYINNLPAGQDLEFSDIVQFITRTLDPFGRYDTFIQPFKLNARVHNTDGTVIVLQGDSSLTVPVNTPVFTKRPLSPRITHWLAGDIVLVRS